LHAEPAWLALHVAEFAHDSWETHPLSEHTPEVQPPVWQLTFATEHHPPEQMRPAGQFELLVQLICLTQLPPEQE
jgi:hypothetical protein